MRLALVGTIVLAACGGSPADMGDDGGGGGSGGSGAMPDAAHMATSCEGRTAQPVDSVWMVSVGGVQRSAKVHVPASYDPSKRTPVVVDIHGRTQSPDNEMALTLSIAKSDAEGFIAIYPKAGVSPAAWNSGTCCDPASTNNIDDTGFFRELLDEAEARLCVDTDRVYMMGMSNGAYQSHRMACELADRVAAVGPVAGLLLFSGCAPSRPVPIMMINGTADSLSQYQYVPQAVNTWKGKNGCTTSTQTFQHGDTTCITYGGCTAGADVVQCTVQDGGHQWPGGGTELPFLGKKSNDLVA